ncbi:rCG46503 [Rattus norvegicus]|uniref:RCG46503 n=1 Tax=Rattus norvegicus TaxID=10116 RepID=A6ID02_RAT|nr:rCG46503 [Rattus norvegicus]
MWTKVLERIG